MTDRPPMLWQRGSYNCIVSGEYTISKFQTQNSVDYLAYHRKKVIGLHENQSNADAAKQACADHARARQ